MTINPYTPPSPQPVEDPPLMAQLSTDVDGMTVEFEQSLDDILALQYYLQRQLASQQPGRWVYYFYGALEVLFVGLTIGLALTPDLSSLALAPLMGCILIGLCIALTAGLPHLNRWLVRRSVLKLVNPGRNLNLVGLRRMTISPEFLISASPITQTISRWVGVEKVLVEDDCLFIFVTTVSAFVLPRRAFNSEQHFREYAAAAEKYRQQGQA